jgi:hypothetical protein
MQRGSPPNHLAGTARVQKFYDRTTLRHRVRMTPSPNDEKGARRRDGHRAASRSTRTTKSGDRPMRVSEAALVNNREMPDKFAALDSPSSSSASRM